eukprot:c21054_g1_i1 orf=621-2627(-)
MDEGINSKGVWIGCDMCFEGQMPYKSSHHTLRSGKLYSSNSLRRGCHSLQCIGRCFLSAVSKPFSMDNNGPKILDPRSTFVQRWNKVFLVSCLIALFVDPLFFFLPSISDADCIQIQHSLTVVIAILRSITDTFYVFHMFLQFRIAYVAPSSRVFGSGVLVVDPKLIARRYWKRDIWLHLLAVLPFPQVVIWIVIPATYEETTEVTNTALHFIIFFQYIPRLILIFGLTSKIIKTAGVVTKTAWAGAAYNLALYILASHVVGACWYALAIERKNSCWRKQCMLEYTMDKCDYSFLYCETLSPSKNIQRNLWYQVTNVTLQCRTKNTGFFDYGIYTDAFDSNIVQAKLPNKYFYCLWWGFRNLSSFGQNLATSTFIGEIVFAISIAIVGLVLFSLLIGNMQTYLQSLGVRIEEWRVRQRDTEEWMRHRQLPLDLRRRVRRFNQYKWVATRGVDEEMILQSLPTDLRRDIKRHLCLDLVLQVPLFSQMDDRLLDAICERLKPVLCTEGMIIVQEGDPVNEMLFVIRGFLDSTTTNGGQTGFFNSIRLFPGHFCGEEILTWALDPKSSPNLPSSTRTVKAPGEVEAFALRAEDLKFVARQFHCLHSKKLQQTFRFYSHQWRTWAACIIQVAWQRHKRRKNVMELHRMEHDKLHNGDMSKTSGDAHCFLPCN